LKAVGEQSSEVASELAALAREGARTLTAQTAETAEQAGRAIRGEARQILTGQKQRVTEGVGRLGSALHQTAKVMRDSDIDAAAGYVQAAAEWVDQVRRYLGGCDVEDLADDLGDWARDYPTVFLGALFAAGVAAGRFVRAGEQLRREDGSPRRRDPRAARAGHPGDAVSRIRPPVHRGPPAAHGSSSRRATHGAKSEVTGHGEPEQ